MIQGLRIVMLFLTGLASLRAGTRGSASYSVSAETLDSCGDPAASQAYHNTASFGDGSGAAATAATATAQPGYIAQLAGATGLVLTASGVSFEETGAIQLAAWETLADATRAALVPAAVAWSAASGPIAVSAAGRATASPVYLDTAAVAAATYAGFNATLPLIVLNTASDNFGSYANDGLRDDWQVQHFGSNNPSAAPAADPDHDGQTNAFECAAALVPSDPASRFILTVQPVPGQPARRLLRFSPRYDTASYAVEASTDLRQWSPLISFTTTDTGTLRTVTDLAASQPGKFYRVVIAGSAVSFTYANDGLPDDWQALYFGVANPLAAPTGDPDRDGNSNAFEYAASLDPADSASHFNLTVSPVPGQPGQRRIDFSPRYDTASYLVEFSTDLAHWSPLTASTTSDSGTLRTVTDLAATGAIRIYRVIVTKL